MHVFLPKLLLHAENEKRSCKIPRYLGLMERLYLGVENPTKFQLKSIPLQRVITPSLCIQKGTTKHAGRGNQSPDHIIIF